MRRAGEERCAPSCDKALKFGTGVPKGPELAQAPEAHMRERALKALEISRGGEALAVGGIGAVAQERDGVEPVELDRVKGPAGSGGRERLAHEVGGDFGRLAPAHRVDCPEREVMDRARMHLRDEALRMPFANEVEAENHRVLRGGPALLGLRVEQEAAGGGRDFDGVGLVRPGAVQINEDPADRLLGKPLHHGNPLVGEEQKIGKDR